MASTRSGSVCEKAKPNVTETSFLGCARSAFAWGALVPHATAQCASSYSVRSASIACSTAAPLKNLMSTLPAPRFPEPAYRVYSGPQLAHCLQLRSDRRRSPANTRRQPHPLRSRAVNGRLFGSKAGIADIRLRTKNYSEFKSVRSAEGTKLETAPPLRGCHIDVIQNPVRRRIARAYVQHDLGEHLEKSMYSSNTDICACYRTSRPKQHLPS